MSAIETRTEGLARILKEQTALLTTNGRACVKVIAASSNGNYHTGLASCLERGVTWGEIQTAYIVARILDFSGRKAYLPKSAEEVLACVRQHANNHRNLACDVFTKAGKVVPACANVGHGGKVAGNATAVAEALASITKPGVKVA